MGVESKKALILPLASNPSGGIRGLVFDQDGIRGAEFQPISEGQPIMGEYVEISPREGSPLLNAEFNRLPGVPSAPRTEGRKGPAKVNSRAYTEGWERIFGKKTEAEA